MKTIIYTLSVIAIMFIISCKDTATHSPLVGRWRVAGYFVSSGGPLQYTPAQDQPLKNVEFRENGTLGGNIYNNYTTYSIKDSRIITINYDSSAPDYAAQQYKSLSLSYGFRNDTLSISPAGPVVCIEGCSTSFVRY